jgi:short-subunit dehydrogenase
VRFHRIKQEDSGMNTLRLKPIREQTIVITGASSGIGLATARAAAEEGAKLVLAARDEESLKRIVDELKGRGADAIHVMADVGQRDQVQAIADRALERFGGFDTWVNDAGVSIYGPHEQVSDEDQRRLFDTNFWGVVYGSQIAVKHLRANGGALINLGSVASEMSLPLQGMYCASKHAIKGFTDALRLELEAQDAPVSVTLIKPTSIATPFAQHAKNYMDREPTLPPPLYKPEDVARAILYSARHPVRDIYVGGAGKVMATLNKNFPSVMDRVSEGWMVGMQLRHEPAHQREDSLAQAGHDGRIDGDYPDRHPRHSLYTPVSRHPVMAGVLVAAAGAATAALLRANSRQGWH